jgi:hypothetical protein
MHWEQRKVGEMGLRESHGVAESTVCQLYVLRLFIEPISQCHGGYQQECTLQKDEAGLTDV